MIEYYGEETISFRQRWSHYLVIIMGIAGLLIAYNLRSGVINAKTIYQNPQAGITAEYPGGWLLDEGGNYIFSVRNEKKIGFKTTLQIATQPVASNTATRSILDVLTLNRSQTLAAYNVLSEEPFTLPNEEAATLMSYTYVDTGTNPFLQSIPIVVRGVDIITIKGGQAIIITFLTDANTYDEDIYLLDQFIETLEF
jgi:hypothetical protein